MTKLSRPTLKKLKTPKKSTPRVSTPTKLHKVASKTRPRTRSVTGK